MVPVLDAHVRQELEAILGIYEKDNCTAWEMGDDGNYQRRATEAGEQHRAAQERFIEREGGL